MEKLLSTGRRARAAVILGASLAGFLAALAPAGADRPAALQEAMRVYEEGDMPRAETLLRTAFPKLSTPTERALGWLYIGLTQAARKDMNGARRSFARSLLEDPELRAEWDRIPPAALAEYDAIRAALEGELGVEASEPGARVLIDGRERGQAPLRLKLPVGRHTVRVISADSARTYEEAAVLVTARAPALVRAKLAARDGKVQLKLGPASIGVYAKGKLLASGPAPVLTLPAGRHELAFRAFGHVEETREVVVEPEKTITLELSLKPVAASPARETAAPWYRQRRVWGWISVGLSGATALTGLLVGRAGQSSLDALHAAEQNGTLDYDHYRALADDVDSKGRLANILFGVAGAAAVTGIVLIVIGDEKGPPARSWRVLPAPGGIALSRRF
jgi:hypothetical protein